MATFFWFRPMSRKLLHLFTGRMMFAFLCFPYYFAGGLMDVEHNQWVALEVHPSPAKQYFGGS